MGSGIGVGGPLSWAQQQWQGLAPPPASIPWVTLSHLTQAQLPSLLTPGSFVEVVNIDPMNGQVDPSTSLYQISVAHPADGVGAYVEVDHLGSSNVATGHAIHAFMQQGGPLHMCAGHCLQPTAGVRLVLHVQTLRLRQPQDLV